MTSTSTSVRAPERCRYCTGGVILLIGDERKCALCSRSPQPAPYAAACRWCGYRVEAHSEAQWERLLQARCPRCRRAGW